MRLKIRDTFYVFCLGFFFHIHHMLDSVRSTRQKWFDEHKRTATPSLWFFRLMKCNVCKWKKFHSIILIRCGMCKIMKSVRSSWFHLERISQFRLTCTCLIDQQITFTCKTLSFEMQNSPNTHSLRHTLSISALIWWWKIQQTSWNPFLIIPYATYAFCFVWNSYSFDEVDVKLFSENFTRDLLFEQTEERKKNTSLNDALWTFGWFMMEKCWKGLCIPVPQLCIYPKLWTLCIFIRTGIFPTHNENQTGTQDATHLKHKMQIFATNLPLISFRLHVH